MQYMQQVQAAGIDNDDPLSSYMLQVCAGWLFGEHWVDTGCGAWWRNGRQGGVYF